MKKIFLSFVFLFLLPTIFYAASEPGGGDVPENNSSDEEFRGGPDLSIRISEAKPKFLTFQFAIGRGEQEMMEFGVRFSCYFRETTEKFNFGLIFSTYYIYAYLLKGMYALNTPGKQHYVVFNTMALCVRIVVSLIATIRRQRWDI